MIILGIRQCCRRWPGHGRLGESPPHRTDSSSYFLSGTASAGATCADSQGPAGEGQPPHLLPGEACMPVGRAQNPHLHPASWLQGNRVKAALIREPVLAGPPVGPLVPKSSCIPLHGFGLYTLLELFYRDKAVCATSIPLPPAATRNAHCPVMGCSHMGAPGSKGAARPTLPGHGWHWGCKAVELLIN